MWGQEGRGARVRWRVRSHCGDNLPVLVTHYKSIPINALTWEAPAWMVPEEAQTTILCRRCSLHSVYPVPGSCSYTGATSIVFVKWLELIRIQMIAASELRGWFVDMAYKAEGFFSRRAKAEQTRLCILDMALNYTLNIHRVVWSYGPKGHRKIDLFL